jgi:transposase
MKKYTTDYKLEVVKSFLAGKAKLLARRLSVPEEKIRTWVSHYRLHGIDGLRPKYSTYSEQFKLQQRWEQRIDGQAGNNECDSVGTTRTH